MDHVDRENANTNLISSKEYFICAISRSNQCSTTGVTNAVVCAILSVGWCI